MNKLHLDDRRRDVRILRVPARTVTTKDSSDEARHIMTQKPKRREGHVEIEQELCKGCEYCVDTCPEECLAMADMINSRGYRFAMYEGDRCTGCGICYYNCPEPGAIEVSKLAPKKLEVSSGTTAG